MSGDDILLEVARDYIERREAHRADEHGGIATATDTLLGAIVNAFGATVRGPFVPLSVEATRAVLGLAKALAGKVEPDWPSLIILCGLAQGLLTVDPVGAHAALLRWPGQPHGITVWTCGCISSTDHPDYENYRGVVERTCFPT